MIDHIVELIELGPHSLPDLPMSNNFSFDALSAQKEFMGYEEKQIEKALDHLVKKGSIEVVPCASKRFGFTFKGRIDAEKRKQDLGLRHYSLAEQKSENIGKLILSIIEAKNIANSQLKGGFFASSPQITFNEVQIYFHKHQLETILDHGKILESKGLIKIDYENKLLKQTDAGRKTYVKTFAKELCIDADTSVLSKSRPLTIFYAWQSDYSNSRNVISKSIGDIIERLNGISKRPLEIVEAIRDGDGSSNILDNIKTRIASSTFFLGDISPIFSLNGKIYSNSCVLIEVGFALEHMDEKNVLLLCKKRDSLTSYLDEIDKTEHMIIKSTEKNWESVSNFPFDISHFARIYFEDKKSLVNRLGTELESRLKQLNLLFE